MTDDMNMSEFMRLSKLFKSLGYTGDEVLKAFEYVESGDEKILNEFLTQAKADRAADEKE